MMAPVTQDTYARTPKGTEKVSVWQPTEMSLVVGDIRSRTTGDPLSTERVMYGSKSILREPARTAW